VQIREVVLYAQGQDPRRLRFRLGALNVISGESRTGKSALLGIIEYCLGRRTFGIPVGFRGPVDWYGLIVHFQDGSEAFIGRPTPKTGAATSSQAMLEFGVDLQPPPFDALRVNADNTTVRNELSARLGITDTPAENANSLRPPLQPHIGHAIWLCLQSQNEVANNAVLFHRAGEREVATALQSLLPYFLGAVSEDGARMQQRLLQARRALGRARRELAAAEQDNEQLGLDIRVMLEEAKARGLTNLAVDAVDLSNETALDALRAARDAGRVSAGAPPSEVARLTELVRRRVSLRRELRAIAERRELLRDSAAGEQGYLAAIGMEADRLGAVDMIPESSSDLEHCPVCRSIMSTPDRQVDDMRHRLQSLREELGTAPVARQRRTQMAAQLEADSERAAAELYAVEAAIRELRRDDADASDEARRAFTRGRIDLFLDRLSKTEPSDLQAYRDVVSAAEGRLAALEEELDGDDAAAETAERLVRVAGYMAEFASEMNVEHADERLRLDLRHLTIVAQTASGPAPLATIGSGENHLGYHVAAHLALHKHFTTEGRPVPRVLVLDQPSQAYYGAEAPTEEFGNWRGDTDNGAVRRLFALLLQFIEALDGQMQVIVTDHAWFGDAWFQEALVEEWRSGSALMPIEWVRDSEADMTQLEMTRDTKGDPD
jgi:hypothetical protein